jgi:uncharacterized protein YlxP (DUF503 family)
MIKKISNKELQKEIQRCNCDKCRRKIYLTYAEVDNIRSQGKQILCIDCITSPWKLTEAELCEASGYVGLEPNFRALLQNVEKAVQRKILEYLNHYPMSSTGYIFLSKTDIEFMIKELGK